MGKDAPWEFEVHSGRFCEKDDAGASPRGPSGSTDGIANAFRKNASRKLRRGVIMRD